MLCSRFKKAEQQLPTRVWSFNRKSYGIKSGTSICASFRAAVLDYGAWLVARFHLTGLVVPLRYTPRYFLPSLPGLFPHH